jgi:hypothetical protein
MRLGRHTQVMDARARRISTGPVARLLRHGRRQCGGSYRLGLRCPFAQRQRRHAGRGASVSRGRHVVGHGWRLRDLRACADGRPGPPRGRHRMARGRGDIDSHICTWIRPGRRSRWKCRLAPWRSSVRCRGDLPGPAGWRSVARGQPQCRLVCRRRSDGHRVGVPGHSRLALSHRWRRRTRRAPGAERPNCRASLDPDATSAARAGP